MPSRPIEVVLARLRQYKPSAGGFKAICPAHEDDSPSLSVSEDADNVVGLKCFAGCELDDIVAALDLEAKDLWPDTIGPTRARRFNSSPKPTKKIKKEEPAKTPARLFDSPGDAAKAATPRNHRLVKSWPYHRDGKVVYYACRYDCLDKEPGEKVKKTFRPVVAYGDKWGLVNTKETKPLYRASELTTNIVFVCEGEKAADALREIGIRATTSSNGSQGGKQSDWSPLSGKNVCIWVDDDPVKNGKRAGDDYFDTAVSMMSGLAAPPMSIRKLQPTSNGKKDDAFDYVQGLRDAGKDDDEILSDIKLLFQDAERVDIIADTSDRPQSIAMVLPAVDELDPRILPIALRDWCKDNAERAQACIDYMAVSVMSVASMLIGRKITVRPKQHDPWSVVPNLWAMAIGEPGSMKSHMLGVPIEFLDSCEKFEAQTVDDDASEYKTRMQKFEMEKRKKLQDDSLSDDDLVAWCKDNEPNKPSPKRYVVNDATVEKLGEILSDNTNGILSYRDELSGFLAAMDKPNDGGQTRAFYLEAWNGKGSYTFDRIGRGTVRIPSTTVSLLGGIQPDVINRFIGDDSGDGFIQRFQLSVWPDACDRRYVDEQENEHAKREAWMCLERLRNLDLDRVDHEVDDNVNAFADSIFGNLKEKVSLPYIRFDAEARELWEMWLGWINQIIANDRLPIKLRGHVSKYQSLAPSIALIIHLCDRPTGRVSRQSLVKAIAWCDYLLSHAKRLYANESNDEAVKAAMLARNWILTRKVTEFSAYDIYHNQRCGIKNKAEAEEVLDILVDRNWLDVIESGTRIRYVVNPLVYSMADIVTVNETQYGESEFDDAMPSFEKKHGHKVDMSIRDEEFNFSQIDQIMNQDKMPANYSPEFAEVNGGDW